MPKSLPVTTWQWLWLTLCRRSTSLSTLFSIALLILCSEKQSMSCFVRGLLVAMHNLQPGLVAVMTVSQQLASIQGITQPCLSYRKRSYNICHMNFNHDIYTNIAPNELQFYMWISISSCHSCQNVNICCLTCDRQFVLVIL